MQPGTLAQATWCSRSNPRRKNEFTIFPSQGKQPWASSRARSRSRRAAFICRTWTVTRPVGVRPIISGPCNVKVIVPQLAPRVERRDDLASVAVHSRQIRPLVQVTAVAGIGAIVESIAASMLPRYDVFHMKCCAYEFITQAAVLATVARAVGNEGPKT